MSEILGADRIAAIRNKKQFTEDMGAYWAGRQDYVRMDDEIVVLRSSSADEIIRRDAAPLFETVRQIAKRYPSFKERDGYKAIEHWLAPK